MSKNATNHRAFINIKCEVAKYGKVTKEAMRFYCESKMSKDKFNQAVSIGMNLNESRD